MKMNREAVLIFSGGLDSTTTLYYALNQGFLIHAITFDYGQRHHIEILKSKIILSHHKQIKHITVNLDRNLFSSSSLTGFSNVPKDRVDISAEIIPSTYVPARNLVFLSMASAYAESQDIRSVFIGINSQDYSGYPDCRNDFISSFETTVNLATRSGREGDPLKVYTPLSDLTKKEIVLLGKDLGVPFELTWSCYDPIYLSDQQAQPCGHCDSCILRRKGFEEAGIQDPASY